MKCRRLVKTLSTAVTGLLLHGPAYGQGLPPQATVLPQVIQPAAASPATDLGPAAVLVAADSQGGNCAAPCGAGASCAPAGSILDRFYAGGEFLLIQPGFSTAIAFARTTTTLTGSGALQQVNATELNFNYDPSFRVFFGVQLDAMTSLQFTYWYLDSSVNVNGAVGAPNQTIVDPFGNVATPGESIQTQASVRMSVYDLDLTGTLAFEDRHLALDWMAGARIADVDQFYSAAIMTAGGVRASLGDFTQTFVGAGPHLGLGGSTWWGNRKQLSLFVKTDLSLLVGDLNIDTTVNLPGVTGQQTASRTRLVPVFETQLGVAWRPLPALIVSAGWEFQAWFDLGTAGGTFGGQFTETHDSNIMWFNGLVVRAQVTF
jgi:Legionella pneumophila major outer membrane protein precursor